MGTIRNQYRILARDTELQSPIGHHRYKWENVNLLKSVSLLIGLSWLRIGMSCGFFLMLNECSQNCEKLFDSVSSYLQFRKGCAVHWGTADLKGAGIRQSLVSGLRAAWPRNCGSNSGRGTNVCGVHNIEGAFEVLPASSSCGTWGEVAGAVRQPLHNATCTQYPVAISTWVVPSEICISQTRLLNLFKHNGYILLSITNMINFKPDLLAVYVH
jgi:hypothetical protein